MKRSELDVFYVKKVAGPVKNRSLLSHRCTTVQVAKYKNAATFSL